MTTGNLFPVDQPPWSSAGGVISFSCEGHPRGQGRPRATVIQKGRVLVYKADLDVAYEESIAAVAIRVMRPGPGDPVLTAALLKATPKALPKIAKKMRLPLSGAEQFRAQWPALKEPVSLRIRFRITPPKSTTKKLRAEIMNCSAIYEGSYDLDNMVKSVMDALNRVCWADDKQVMKIEAIKVASEKPGIDIIIEPLNMPRWRWFVYRVQSWFTHNG